MSDQPTNIVVLDGYTLNPGDISWDPITSIAPTTIHDRSTGAVVERATGAPVVLTNKAVLGADEIAALPELAYIGVLATGTNVVDLDAASSRGIVVTNVPGYSTDSVAQHVFAMILELTVRSAAHSISVHEGRWVDCDDFSYTLGTLPELAGKTLGIVGLGSIGQRVARIGHALGMNIAAAHQRSMDSVSIHGVPIQWLPLEDLLAESDVVTLHCPLTEATHELIQATTLARMKSSAILINTGRGPLIHEGDLATALKEGTIGAAGLDVLSSEPPAADNPLLQAPNCLITPHIAWATREARIRLMNLAASNIQAFLDGAPENQVNG